MSTSRVVTFTCKDDLRQMYEDSVRLAIATRQPTAFYVFDANGEPHIGKLSLQEYVSEHGYEESVVWAHENIVEKRYWLIDCVGGEFIEKAGAFDEAWGNRDYYHESRAESSEA